MFNGVKALCKSCTTYQGESSSFLYGHDPLLYPVTLVAYNHHNWRAFTQGSLEEERRRILSHTTSSLEHVLTKAWRPRGSSLAFYLGLWLVPSRCVQPIPQENWGSEKVIPPIQLLVWVLPTSQKRITAHHNFIPFVDSFRISLIPS